MSQQIDDKKRVRAQLTSRSDQLRTTRTEHTVELYARAAFGNVIQKPKNAIQKQTGFDITNRMRGEVPYSSLRIVYIGFICEELTIRGAEFDSNWSIKKLSEQLMKYDLEVQKLEILETTGCKNPKMSKLNSKTFLPLCNKSNKYEIQKED